MDAHPKFDPAVRRNSGIALDHAVLHFDGAAHGVDHTAELAINPSPVRFTMRPLCTPTVGSTKSLRSALSRASVRSSSAPARRLNPTTSAARIAASFRVSVMAALLTSAK
jgi:hypothetical protein